jgi:hypothetical protein
VLARVGGDLLLRAAALRAALEGATAVAARRGSVDVAAHIIAFEIWNFLAWASTPSPSPARTPNYRPASPSWSATSFRLGRHSPPSHRSPARQPSSTLARYPAR